MTGPETSLVHHGPRYRHERIRPSRSDQVRRERCGRACRGERQRQRYGMRFAREADCIWQRFFGAHKWRRTAFAGGDTGLEIQRNGD